VAAPFFLQKLLNLEEDFYLFSFSDKKFEMLAGVKLVSADNFLKLQFF
jgi:hypothetical protein